MKRAQGAWGAAKAGGVRTQTPGAADGSSIGVPALRPSFARRARIRAGVRSPIEMPFVFSPPAGRAATDAAYQVSMSARGAGKSAIRVLRPAAATAASPEAGPGMFGTTAYERNGNPSIAS